MIDTNNDFLLFFRLIRLAHSLIKHKTAELCIGKFAFILRDENKISYTLVGKTLNFDVQNI